MTKAKQAHNHDPAQGAMFNQERAVAGRNHPRTSHIAAKSVKKIKATHELILHMIQQHGPMTDYELRDQAAREGFRISWSGMSARRGEMCPPRGYGLRDSGATRPTPNDRPAIVWEIDPHHLPEVPPPKVRNLRHTQKAVLATFKDALALGIDRMSHAQLVVHCQQEAERNGWEVQSDASIRTRCAELVDLKLVKRYPDSDTEKGKIAMWGLA